MITAPGIENAVITRKVQDSGEREICLPEFLQGHDLGLHESERNEPPEVKKIEAAQGNSWGDNHRDFVLFTSHTSNRKDSGATESVVQATA